MIMPCSDVQSHRARLLIPKPESTVAPQYPDVQISKQPRACLDICTVWISGYFEKISQHECSYVWIFGRLICPDNEVALYSRTLVSGIWILRHTSEIQILRTGNGKIRSPVIGLPLYLVIDIHVTKLTGLYLKMLNLFLIART